MPESPTADEIGHRHRANEISVLAARLHPENGYKTATENLAASVFSLLVETARVYTELTAHVKGRPDDADTWSTLTGLAENLATETASFSVARYAMEPPAKVANVSDIQALLEPRPWG